MQNEKIIGLSEAADAVGCFIWQLRRAVKRGDIPYYQPYNSRKYVRLSEVLMFIEASKKGGVE